MRKVILQIIKRPGEILRLDCRRKLPRHSPRISGSEPSVSVDCPVAQQFKILHVMASWQVGALECIRHAHAVQAVLCTAVEDFGRRSEEDTFELHSQMRISYAVFCLKKKKT